MAWKLEVLCLVYLKALIAYSILKRVDEIHLLSFDANWQTKQGTKLNDGRYVFVIVVSVGLVMGLNVFHCKWKWRKTDGNYHE